VDVPIFFLAEGLTQAADGRWNHWGGGGPPFFPFVLLFPLFGVLLVSVMVLLAFRLGQLSRPR